jgi:hypothetical protein
MLKHLILLFLYNSTGNMPSVSSTNTIKYPYYSYEDGKCLPSASKQAGGAEVLLEKITREPNTIELDGDQTVGEVVEEVFRKFSKKHNTYWRSSIRY